MNRTQGMMVRVGVIVFLCLSIACVGVQGQSVDRAPRAHFGGSARSMAMGGAYLALARGWESVFWNPAGLARKRPWSVNLVQVSGRLRDTTPGDLWDLYHLGDDIQELADHIDSDIPPEQLFLQILEAYFNVRDYAVSHGATAAVPYAPDMSLYPATGFSIGPVGVAAMVSAYGSMNMWVDHPDPPVDVGSMQNVVLDGILLTFTDIGIAYGYALPWLDAGITVRWVRADTLRGTFGSRLIPPVVAGEAYEPARDQGFDVDFGVSVPLSFTPGHFQAAVVARNLLHPGFQLESVRTTGETDPPLATRRSFNLDAGLGWEYGPWDFAVDLHNLTGAGPEPVTLHAGMEYRFSIVGLRVGMDRGKPVLGLGLHLGPLDLDTALALTGFERFALGVSFRSRT